MKQTNSIHPFKNRTIIASLLFCVLSPMLAAYLLFFFKDHFHFKITAHGELVTPPIPATQLGFNAEQFKGKWQFLYIQPSSCDKICHNNIELLNNIHIALGKDQQRVRLHLLPMDAVSGRLKEGSIGILDPQGFLMMQYPTTLLDSSLTAKGLLEDMRRLLRYSHAR